MPKTANRDMHKAKLDLVDFPKGDDRPLERMYRSLYQPYLAWAIQRWGNRGDVLEEAFNEAVMIFRRKAWDGSLESYVGKQLNTIIFSFAANLIRNRLKVEQQYQERFQPLDEKQAELEGQSEKMIFEAAGEGIFREGAEGRAAKLKVGFAQLTARCQQILLLRIVHGFSMPEIAVSLGLSSANSAKTAKNKCQNRLKQLLGVKKE